MKLKVCADLRQNNKKSTVLQLKMGEFVKFCQKSIFLPQGKFSSFCQVFHQKRNPLEP